MDWKTCGMKCDTLLCSMLTEFVQNKSPYVWHGYVYAVSMFCLSVLGNKMTYSCEHDAQAVSPVGKITYL